MRVKAIIEVAYSGPLNPDYDEYIRKTVELLPGVEWYSQGYNLVNEVRDICFDLELPEDATDKDATKG